MSPPDGPAPAPPKPNNPWFSRKNSPLLGKEEAESCEVHLLFISLDLGEVGVDREVGYEVLRHAVFQIESDVATPRVGDLRHRGAVTRHIGDRVRLDLEATASVRYLDSDERRGEGRLEDPEVADRRPFR